MPLIQFQKLNKSTLYLWERKETINDLSQLLPTNLVDQIKTDFHLEKRKAEKMVQYLLMEKAHINYKMITYTNKGKPLVREKGIHLSFSHSDILSVLMVSPVNCGVDVEKENPKLQRIAPRFMNDMDRKAIRNSDDIAWIWTIKEAIYKFFGNEVSFKRDLFVQSFNWESKTANVLYRGKYGKKHFNLSFLRLGNYYLAFTNGINAI